MSEPVNAGETETLQLKRMVTYRCSCGADVRVEQGGSSECPSCQKAISLQGLDATQTVSFCSEVGSGTSFHLTDGPDRSGEELGHFRLLSKLGYGGMGAVYRALDESLQRFVAVKVMRSAEEGTGTTVKEVTRLLDEAVSQARLNHPNVVTIYYVGREGEEPFFAMELLPGPTLAQLVSEHPLAYVDVIHYSLQVVDALKQASQQGLVHGDIKPSNLILSDRDTVKLGDFGLAKTERTMPATGISGTISYMAPELSAGCDASDQSDMYALGVTLFELTFGRRPYAVTGSTLTEQLKNKRSAEIEFPEKWPASVPEQWRNVLERLMAKSPEDRYSDYDALRHDLQTFAPVGVTNAGLLTRGLAYTVDLMFWGMLIGLIALPAVFGAQLEQQLDQIAINNEGAAYYFGVLSNRLSLFSFLSLLVPLFATYLEWRGLRSLGRYLFQLRVVDSNGLRVNRRKRAIRSVIRYAPLWAASLTLCAASVGWSYLAVLLSPVDEIISLINTIPVLGKKRMALHDRIVGSRVVLDTQSQKARP